MHPCSIVGSPTFLKFALIGTMAVLVTDRHAVSAMKDQDPVTYGWTPLGQVTLDKTGCTACPATFPVNNRYVYFGLATDTPSPVFLSGQFDVKCIDGASYHNFVSSSFRGGIFQIVQNSCMNYETNTVTLSLTSVGLSPPDRDRMVVLTVYGIVHPH